MDQPKRLWIPFALLLLAYTLATRFISYELPPPKLNPPPKHCIAKQTPHSLPSTSSDGEPLETCSDLDAINQVYVREIKPIFEAKCLMCHGVVSRMPLYARIPPASWLIRSDIREAKEHSDMSYDFPFVGKEVDVPQDGLEDLVDVLQQNSMPPLQYKLMHWKSGLSREERDSILKWAKASLKRLND